MPRGPRVDAPSAVQHVTARGIDKQPIFIDDADCTEFVERLARVVNAGELRVFAWALVWNHLHLLVETGSSLARAMQSLLTGYAMYFNRRHARVGHVFQNRYYSRLCTSEGYFRRLVQYVHLNPLGAGIVSSLSELDRYPFSGHSAVMGLRRRPWQDTKYVLDLFGSSPIAARRAYRAFIADGVGTVSDDKAPDEPLDVEPVGTPPSEVRVEPSSPSDVAFRLAMGEVLLRVCRAVGIAPAALKSGSTNRKCCLARDGLAFLWMEMIGGSARALVEEAGIARGAVYRCVRRGRARAAEWKRLLNDLPLDRGSDLHDLCERSVPKRRQSVTNGRNVPV